MEGAGEIKYPGQTKTSTAALRLTERSVKARGRKPRKKKSPVPPGWGLCEGPATVHGKHLQAKYYQRRNGTFPQYIIAIPDPQLPYTVRYLTL